MLALVAVIGFTLGVFLESVVPVAWPILAFWVLLSFVFFMGWLVARRKTYRFIACVLLFTALGALRTCIVSTELPSAFEPLLGVKMEHTATVVADADIRETSQRITLALIEGEEHTKAIAVIDRYQPVSYGDQVVVTGALELPQPFGTDGGRTFNYQKFLAKDGITALIPKAQLRVVGQDHSVVTVGLRELFALKHGFAHAIEEALPEPYASLAEGLLTGGKQGLGTNLLDAFTVAGLLPIVVLSGYNVMIVAEAVLAGLSFLPKRLALSVAGFCVAVFVIAAGSGTSAVRAGFMAGLALFARSTHRTYDALRALLFVLVLMLLINPLSLVFDPGFDFSFIATLGLILASSDIEAHLGWIRPGWLREVAATTIAAQLFVLPLILYQTGNLSLAALPANMLVLPVIPLAMALSAIAGVGTLIIPSVAVLLGLPAYGVLFYIVMVAEWIARLPLASVIVPAFPFVLVPGMYVGVAGLLYWIRKKAPSGAVSS